MKKFAKMSLVAAVAVAGLSTVSSAKPLAEAIQDVDVSGSVVYRYDDRSYDNNAKDKSSNSYKAAMTAKVKANDDVTVVTRFFASNADNSDFAALDYTNTGDANPSVNLSNAYFSYTGLANTTINVGKQGLTTPWTVAVDPAGNEQTGTGILALTNVGPVTVAGAYFNQSNINKSGDIKVGDGSENIAVIGVMGNLGPVALDAWYNDIQDILKSYTIGAKASFGDEVKFSLGARHTNIDLEGKDKDDTLTKVTAGLKMGIFGAKAGYGWTDKDGGIAALDNDAKTGFQGWTLNLNGKADAKLMKFNVNAQVLPSLNLALNYNILDKDVSDTTDKEYYLQATYKMSKNFGGYLRFGQAELEKADGDVDRTMGRIHVAYTF